MTDGDKFAFASKGDHMYETREIIISPLRVRVLHDVALVMMKSIARTYREKELMSYGGKGK